MVFGSLEAPQEFAADHAPMLFPKGRINAEWREYDPFVDEPDMFLQLAICEPTPGAIARFATRFGGVGRHLHDFGPSNPRKPILELGRLLEWDIAIDDMKHVVGLWQAVQSGDSAALSEYVRWEGKTLRIERRGKRPISRWIQTFERMAEWDAQQSERYKPGDLLGPARDFMLERVDHALKTLKIHTKRTGESVTLEATAETLRDIARVQFAFAVLEKWQLAYCQRCGLPFSEDENRSDRTFCSDSCRVMASRERKKRAIELRADGATLHAIVKEVGSDLETVKKWLQPKGENDAKKKKGTRRR